MNFFKKGIIICFVAVMLQGIASGAEDFSKLKTSGDELWKDRDNIIKLKACIETYEKALGVKPGDQIILSRLSIGYYWLGNMNNGKVRQEAYLKGMSYGEKLTAINPKSAPGIFWHATNNAAYCKERGFVKSALNIGSIKEKAQEVIKIDQYYYRGGPQRLLGRIYWGTPWYARKKGESLQDGADLIKDAISKYPNFLLSYIFLGDIYWEMGKKKMARETFEKVFTIPENALPEFMAENRRDRKEAKKKLKEYFGLE